MPVDGGTETGSELVNDSYAFVPAGNQFEFSRAADATQLLLLEKRYEPLTGARKPELLVEQASERPGQPFLGDPEARLQTLLPETPAFDMAVNIFTYQPGATLPMVECHIMEHGLLMLGGQGIYRLDTDWHPVQEGDVIWMAPYCPQWFVAMGKTPASYIYYKDVNRSPHSDPCGRKMGRRGSRYVFSCANQRKSAPSGDRGAGGHLRATSAGRDARFVFRRGLRSARTRQRSVPRRRPGRKAKMRWAISSRAGPAADPVLPLWPPARTSTPSPMPGAMMEWSVCWVPSKRCERCDRHGFAPTRSIELIVFTAEEPTRFGIGCLGSRLLSGACRPKRPRAFAGPGRKVARCLARESRLWEARRCVGSTAAGLLLRLRRIAHRARPVVGAGGRSHRCCGADRRARTLRVELTGAGGHAGAVLMPERHDALLAGAEIALAVERAAMHSGSPDTVAPRAFFASSRAPLTAFRSARMLEIDLRDTQRNTRDAALRKVEEAMATLCQARGISWELERLNVDPPAVCDGPLVQTVAEVCAELGLP